MPYTKRQGDKLVLGTDTPSWMVTAPDASNELQIIENLGGNSFLCEGGLLVIFHRGKVVTWQGPPHKTLE